MEEKKKTFTYREVCEFAIKGDIKSLEKVPKPLLSKPDGLGIRPMHLAAQHGQIGVIEWLVEDPERDAGVNKPDEDARNPLHWAAWHGQADAVVALLEMGALRDKATRTGYTPLHYVSCIYAGLS